MVFKWGLGCRYLQQLPVPIAGRLVGPHLNDPPAQRTPRHLKPFKHKQRSVQQPYKAR